jgi:hypothetical protein
MRNEDAVYNRSSFLIIISSNKEVCNQKSLRKTLEYDNIQISFVRFQARGLKARPEVGFPVTVMVCSSKTNENARVILKVK